MRSYLDMLEYVRRGGVGKHDRTGTGTRSVFHYCFSHDLREGFPLLTTKKIPFSSVVAELLWFISGSTNVKDLQARGCSIWDEWADKETGDLGPIYGKQWRRWGEKYDQLSKVISNLQNDPFSRRLVVSAWNVSDLPDMALEPCHLLFQLNAHPAAFSERYAMIEPDKEKRIQFLSPDDILRLNDQMNGEGIPKYALDIAVYQRSCDIFLGVPFNIASYALLLTMIATHVNMIPGRVNFTFGDLHIYNNHMEQVSEQLMRKPKALPTLELLPSCRYKTINAVDPSDIILHGYDPLPAIKAEVAV